MEPSDIELMLRVRAGDPAAFHQLARRYREPLRRYFAALAGSAGPVDDLAQETLLRLWLVRERYEPTGRFAGYLFSIARHHWLNQRKKQQKRPARLAPLEEAALEAAPFQVNQPERVLLERLRHARIRQAIAALPEHYRVVFQLCQIEGWSYAEAADRLGIPLGTVKSRMAGAVRRLRAGLSGEEEEREE
jgi:RNA polymerase sigma-70 factor (ECF subfamily)